jgi:hypothetical protein
MAEFLGDSDRLLLRAVYADGKNAAEIARLTRQDRRAVQRRVQRLAARVLSPEFGFIAGHARSGRDEHGWDAPTRAVALVCVLQGRSVRAAAGSLGMTQHAVRARRSIILAVARGAARANRAASRAIAPPRWRDSGPQPS